MARPRPRCEGSAGAGQAAATRPPGAPALTPATANTALLSSCPESGPPGAQAQQRDGMACQKYSSPEIKAAKPVSSTR